MKIIAINAEHTKSIHDAAFEVDSPPDREVMACIEYGSLQISFRDPYLHVKSAEHEPPICSIVVNNINLKYAEAEKQVKDMKARAASVHKGQVMELEHLTGLSAR